MKIKYLLLALLVTAAAACKWGVPDKKASAITKDTLTYTYKIFKQRAPDCGDKPDSSCTVVNFRYPVFNNEKALNDSVNSKIIAAFSSDDKPSDDFTKIAAEFMANYKSYKQDDVKDPVSFYMDATVSVVKQDSSLTTLQVETGSYQGGAHPSGYTWFINWNTKAHQSIALSDIFMDGYLPKLTAIAEVVFRKQEKLSPTASLANDYFFKDDKFSLANTYLITPLGIRFFYNEYEIKPYAAGQTDLFIPYAQIKQLLRPNTVVKQYIK